MTPRRNRVDPFGELVADPARGSLMGNRGQLHGAHGEIKRFHRGNRWIFCLLEFKRRWRELMQPGQYTELFFLDEATAFAAGHRPCMECMRERAVEFRDAWESANPELTDGGLRLPEVDGALQRERIGSSGEKVTFEASPAELPDGAMVVSGPTAKPYLVDGGRLHPWSFTGYGPAIDGPQSVNVLTPRSVVRTFAAGFRPRF
ncbi:MAG: hypothetical protein U0R51_01545 [Solirubrobacterales bacterium]